MTTAHPFILEQQLESAGVAGELRDALVLRHLPQVRIVARRLAERLPPHVELADLVGAGILGLIDAVSKFDASRDVSLATYAQFRIRGAILDSLRSQDWGSRRLRRLARRIADARRALTLSLGRYPADAELAAHLGISLEDYHDHRRHAHSLEIARFADPADDETRGVALGDLPAPGLDALEGLLRSEFKTRLSAAADALPVRERRVVALYYLEELTMSEVAARMGVSESRVSQLHSSALARLKKTLRH